MAKTLLAASRTQRGRWRSSPTERSGFHRRPAGAKSPTTSCPTRWGCPNRVQSVRSARTIRFCVRGNEPGVHHALRSLDEKRAHPLERPVAAAWIAPRLEVRRSGCGERDVTDRHVRDRLRLHSVERQPQLQRRSGEQRAAAAPTAAGLHDRPVRSSGRVPNGQSRSQGSTASEGSEWSAGRWEGGRMGDACDPTSSMRLARVGTTNSLGGAVPFAMK